MSVRFALPCLLLLLFAAPPAMAAGIAMSEVDAGGFPASLNDTGTGPLVVFIAGSGPTDRNGNSVLGVRASYLEKLAAALAAQGFSSLRYDKRAIPGSAPIGDEADVTLQTYVDDLGTVVGWVRERWPDRPVVLAGHSEGGLIAMRAASTIAPSGLVLLASPGRPVAETLRTQLAAIPEKLRERALEILIELEAGHNVAEIPPELAALFRPSVQPFLISLFESSPAETLRGLDTPVLIVGGGTDLQVGRPEFDALLAARPDADSVWLPAINHVLTDTVADRQANFATYARPDLPLSKGLTEAIVEFLRGLSQD